MHPGNIFGVLVVIGLIWFILDRAWDKVIRPYLFEDKLDGMREDAMEDFTQHVVEENIEKNLSTKD